MGQLIDLSHPIQDGQAAFPPDPPIRIETTKTVASDGFYFSEIFLGSHHGTHLDAPFHFLPDAPTLDRIPLDRFYGPCRLVDLAPGGNLPPQTPLTLDMLLPHADSFVSGQRVILRTGWYEQFGNPGYFTALPSLSAEAARWIAATGIVLLGMDMPTPSLDEATETHHALLGAGIVVVEGLNNLHRLPAEFLFVGFPLNFVGGDGSPIRAVAVTMDT